MKPTSITNNVKLIIKNTVDDVVHWVEENLNNATQSIVVKKGKR